MHGFEKLKSFVHVSTLYSNCNRQKIDEKIYDHTLNYHQLVTVSKLLKDMKTKERKEMEKLLFNDFPNTYTLTKHFAEKLVYHQAYFLPTGIFRPPLVRKEVRFEKFFCDCFLFYLKVMSSYKDCPGFTDNINGPTGIIAWTCRGYLHVIYGDKKLRSNFVPVDYCINALLVCAWDIHDKWENYSKC